MQQASFEGVPGGWHVASLGQVLSQPGNAYSAWQCALAADAKPTVLFRAIGQSAQDAVDGAIKALPASATAPAAGKWA